MFSRTKAGQAEGGKMLVLLIVLIISFILIAYFGYSWFKSQTKSFEGAQPRLSPVPLITIPIGVGGLLKRRWIMKKGAMDTLTTTIMGAILTVGFLIAIWLVLKIVFPR